MRQFNITVNGTGYQVSVEEVSAFAAPVAAPAPVVAPVAAPAAAPAPVVAPAPKAPAAPVSGGTKINAPMPGSIIGISVSEGATVKKGDVLMILEAMKMENEILSPVTGTVLQIATTKGASVNSGDSLAVVG